MRVPEIENYSAAVDLLTLSLTKPIPIERSYMIVNDKDKVKLIKTIERIVRGSIEYKQYIKFLKDEIDMTCCSFFTNVNSETPRVKLEIHHEPFTLFDITNIVLTKYIDEERPINPLTIAEEVMLIHYRNMVGLIPLSSTVHGLVHDGRLVIPLQCVYGDYLSFIDEYFKYIPEDVLNALQAKIELSKDIQKVDTSILNKRYVYLEVDGFTLPKTVE
jgi:hypothetical protein